jgi:hypothetical protein
VHLTAKRWKSILRFFLRRCSIWQNPLQFI